MQGEGDLVQHCGAVVAEDDLLELDDVLRQSGESSGAAILAWCAVGVDAMFFQETLLPSSFG
jgi:hypothetical protein